MTQRILMTHPTSLGRPGGGTIGFLEIAAALDRAGADVTILSVDRGPWPNPVTPVETMVIPAVPGHRYLDAFRVATAVASLMRDRPFDLVIGWSSEVAAIRPVLARAGTRLAMIAAKPSYEAWWHRAVRLRGVKRLSDRSFLIRPLRSAGTVFALSDFTKGELVSLFGVRSERIVVAHWGVDTSFGAVPARPVNVPIERLLFSGSWDREKGVFDAIEAVRILAARGGASFELRIAGWGDEDGVRAAAVRAGIQDRVSIIGFLDRPALLDALAWAQLAILPSHVESFGLAIAEAQASGLPVISYRAGAIPEVVEDGVTGILVPSRRTDDLARALQAAVDDPVGTASMGEAGRTRIAQTFTWDRTAGRILEAVTSRLGAAV